jgi:hypothetical protein
LIVTILRLAAWQYASRAFHTTVEQLHAPPLSRATANACGLIFNAAVIAASSLSVIQVLRRIRP